MSSVIAEFSNLHIFVEHNISYQTCKFQLSRMSGFYFTVEVKIPPPRAVPGEKSPVLLGLRGRGSTGIGNFQSLKVNCKGFTNWSHMKDQ